MKSLFIGAHLDDAIFSCGKLISIMEEPSVLTVFGGIPKNGKVCTAYDQKSGFESAEEAVIKRRAEDASALTLISAEQLWFNIPENQYGEKRDISLIQESLEKLVKGYDEVYFPLGLLHPDHEIVGELMRRIVDDKRVYYIYMDLPYYVDNPEIAVNKLQGIKDSELQYSYRGGDLGKKMLSIACYRSQVPITNIYHLMADERYYKLS
jgi:LmbE family N-acetylglucosaminyl deacetylase